MIFFSCHITARPKKCPENTDKRRKILLKINHIARIFLASLLMVVAVGHNKNLFSWGLFTLFTDTDYSSESVKKIEEFNPDEDILYLPGLEGKELFAAVNDLSITRKTEVRKFIYIYLTRGREYVKNAIERSNLYMDTIMGVISSHPEIPAEIALLPLLESGFNPRAVSKSRAVGLWQFIPGTSALLGLKNDRWVDERRNIRKSTEAAVRHLKGLYSVYGNWELALAAYNGGAGYISKMLKKTGTSDLWDLRETGELKKETDEYVPRFIAMLLIYKNQKMFGISGELQETEPLDPVTVKLTRQVNLKRLSAALKLDYQTLRLYNPELNRILTPPVKSYALRLPREAAELFMKDPDRHIALSTVKGAVKSRI